MWREFDPSTGKQGPQIGQEGRPLVGTYAQLLQMPAPLEWREYCFVTAPGVQMFVVRLCRQGFVAKRKQLHGFEQSLQVRPQM